MFGIAAAQLLANHGVGALPEPRQVVGHLLRATVRGQQVQQDLRRLNKVYLRLNDIPVPSVYGPTADETG